MKNTNSFVPSVYFPKEIERLWQPDSIQSWFDDLQRSLFPSSFFGWLSDSKYPTMNVKNAKNAFIVEMAVAGHTKDSITVQLDNDGWLEVRGKSVVNNTEEIESYLLNEMKLSSFSKRVKISNINLIDVDNITSTCENGILSITLPKKEIKEELPKIKTIAVQ
jgi:HSP20 family protein